MAIALKSAQRIELTSILNRVKKKQEAFRSIETEKGQAEERLKRLTADLPNLRAQAAASPDDARITELVVCERKITFTQEAIAQFEQTLQSEGIALFREIKAASVSLHGLLFGLLEDVKASVVAKIAGIFSEQGKAERLANESDPVTRLREFANRATCYISAPTADSDPMLAASHVTEQVENLIAGRVQLGMAD